MKSGVGALKVCVILAGRNTDEKCNGDGAAGAAGLAYVDRARESKFMNSSNYSPGNLESRIMNK